MPLTILTGTATHVAMGSDVTYAASAQYGPIAQHNHALTLRIDGRPVFFRSRAMPSVSEGDRIAIAGPMKSGTLQGLALGNLTTGAMYCPNTTLPIIACAVVVVLGIPLIAILGIGLFFIAVGGWAVWKFLQIRKAGEMVRSAAATTPATA
jgi:hypothetical protein